MGNGQKKVERSSILMQEHKLLNQLMEGKTNHFESFARIELHETELSRQIKVLAEVEKIWIIYDVDRNGTLELDEIKEYLKCMAFPALTME